jgi:hypothetical protein
MRVGFEPRKLQNKQKKNIYMIYLFMEFSFLARRDNCPKSYCHDPGVGVSLQGKNFNLGYIFLTIRDRMLILYI